jgi:hypothetical protein
MRARSVAGRLAISVAAVAAGVTVALAALAGDDADAARVVDAGGVTVLVAAEPDPDALVAGVGLEGGRVTLVGGQCLGLGRGDAAAGVVWPHGTEVRGSGRAVELVVDGVRLHIGSKVDGGVADLEGQPSPRDEDFDGRVSDACVGRGYLHLTDVQAG